MRAVLLEKYWQQPIAADFEPSGHRSGWRSPAGTGNRESKLSALWKRVNAEARRGLAVAVVLVRALAVIRYSVDSVGQLKGQTVARQIDRGDVLAGKRRGNRAVREHKVFSNDTRKILRAPPDAEFDAAAEMLRLDGNRAHHALCAVESVQTDKSLDPLKRHLSHALVVDIRAGKLREKYTLNLVQQ